MKTTFLIHGILTWFLVHPLAGQEDWQKVLGDALFQEEAESNLTAAEDGYLKVAKHYEAQRKLGATAVFRLAEVFRKQGKNAKAIARYQQILREFPEQQALVTLSEQNLKGLGADSAENVAGTTNAPHTEEGKTIADLQRLLANSPDLVNAISDEKMGTPLHVAARKSQLQVAGFLLDHGANIEALVDGATPLQIACAEGHKAMVSFLIERGAKLDTSALVAAINHDRRVLLKFLLEQDTKEFELGEALIAAAGKSGVEVVNLLLSRGADVNATADQFAPFTSLTMAIKGKKDTLVDLLLKAGADVNTKSYPSLFAAVDIVSPHLVNRLLQSGANPNSKFLTAEGKVYSNPLLSAIVHEQRSTEIVEALIKAGADLNQICSYKPGAQRTPFQSHDATPFHRLIEQGANAELLALAAKYGADPMIETGGKTAWKLAEPWVARLMVKFFLYPNAVSDAGVYVSLPEHHLVFPVVSRTSDNEAAPSLAAALSSVPKFLSKKQLDGLAPHNDYAHIVRSSGDDRFAQEILVNFTALSSGNVALPPLQWGDVIEFTSASYEDPEEGKRPPQPTGSSKETSTSDKWLTHLKRSSAFMRRHLPMPFELHYGDLQWNLTTGSWGLTDPHSNSVPASSLVDLLRPMWDDPALDRSRIVIERLSDEGGERFTIPVEMSKRYASITLAENDRIILKRLANEDMLEKRRLGVFATQPGSRYFRQVYKKQDPAFPPSLFHLIAAVFDDELLILPHPNLSELTIVRLSKDGQTERLSINLHSLIDEDAEDVPLLWGDVVEIPRFNDRDGNSWTALEERARLFLTGKLSRSVVQQLEGAEQVRFAPAFHRYTFDHGIWKSDLIWESTSEVKIYALDYHLLIKGGLLDNYFKAWDLIRDDTLYRVTRKDVWPQKVWVMDGDVVMNGESDPKRPRMVSPQGKRRVILPPGLQTR